MKRISDKQRLFPNITFTCNGSIIKWIVGAIARSGALQPELQIWRNIGGTSYTCKANFNLLPSSIALDSNIVEYIPNPPLEFQEGDILGVHQTKHMDSALVIYSQEHDGPANYDKGQNPPSTVTLSGNPNGYDYPLVTVEISTGKIL